MNVCKKMKQNRKIQQHTKKEVEQNNDLISSHNHLVILEILNNMNCKKSLVLLW